MSFPETMPVTQGAWATYIPGRRPEFKTHTNSGHAKNALMQYHHQGYHNHPQYGEYLFRHTNGMGLYELAQTDAGSVWKLKTEVKYLTDKSDYPEIWPNAK